MKFSKWKGIKILYGIVQLSESLKNVKPYIDVLGSVIFISRRGVLMIKRISIFISFCCILLTIIACESNEAIGKTVVLPDTIPSFVQQTDFNNIDWERKAVEFGERGVVGNENKSGIIADAPSLNGQKWMWHLWGVREVDLTVIGFHKETETVNQILVNGWSLHTAGENNGADTHAPSSVKIPMAGEWAILLYTDGNFFDTFVIEINE